MSDKNVRPTSHNTCAPALRRIKFSIMPPLRQGSIHLFRAAGVDVFLHWSWFLVAIYEINTGRAGRYSSITWNILEYLCLFLIVLLHEYGHALACRQVGGIANRIVLWPLGGVAYVDPPPRPGATLWSIAAGPLVNVALLVLLSAFGFATHSREWGPALADQLALLRSVWWINLGLLLFNILPIYPLDGGQILRSLLWFPLGRARSLMVAVVIGFIGFAAMIAMALWARDTWFAILAFFILINCWGGLQQARGLLKLQKLPRREGYICPCCRTAPPVGAYWVCSDCKRPFDTFEQHGVCPNCKMQFSSTACLDCRRSYPLSEWMAGSFAVSRG